MSKPIHKLSPLKIHSFRKTIWDYYAEHGRNSFSWRSTHDPYLILVSEIMLQQTQTERVMKKYPEFIKKFPDISSLASASLETVLRVWQGMGYNRRAIALKKIADLVTTQHGGIIPDDYDTLIRFPGVGKATASAVLAFAYNKPSVFVETNIRRVYIYHFFKGMDRVTDMDILTLVRKTLDNHNPREWYYALMDYGVMLKKEYPGLIKRSAHYSKQSKFEGSDRQIRGKILRILLQNTIVSETRLLKTLGGDHSRVMRILDHLVKEGFISRKGKKYSIG